MLKCDLLPTSEAARLNIFHPKFSFQVAPTLDHCGLYPRPIFDTEKKFNLSERKPPATYFSLNTPLLWVFLDISPSIYVWRFQEHRQIPWQQRNKHHSLSKDHQWCVSSQSVLRCMVS